MKTKHKALLLSLVSLFIPYISSAAPSNTLNYQGKLTDSAGVIVTDGSYNFKLTLWDSETGGTCLWSAQGSCATPTAKSIPTIRGIFSTELGASSDNPLTIDFNSDTYLQIQVNSDSPMSPRKKVNASAYSLNSKKLDGHDSTYFLDTSDTNQTKQGSLTLGNTSSDFLNIYGGNTTNGDIQTTSGSLTVKPQAGQDVNVALSGSGEFAVNSNQLYVDGNTGNVGIGTSAPTRLLDVNGAIHLSTTTSPLFPQSGDIYSSGSTVYYYNGVDWVDLAASGSTPAGTNGAIQFNNSGSFGADTSNFFWDDTNNRLGIGTSAPVATLDVQGVNSNATVGSEMITNAADRDFSSSTGNWSGTNWTIGSGVATHTAGNNTYTLSNSALSAAPVAGNTYQITFDITTTTTGTLTTSIGGVNGAFYGQSLGTFVARNTIITAATSGNLIFTPNATWSGTIDNVSVKIITPSSPAVVIRNSSGLASIDIRPSSSTDSLFIGLNSGKFNTGSLNSAIGFRSLYSNTTGATNTAMGANSLSTNTTGASNTAMGESSLFSNTTGSQNSAVGTISLYSNTTGYQNSAIGHQSLYSNTTGYSNSAMGFQALLSNTTGISNSAVGDTSLRSNTTGSANVAVGYQSLYSNTTGYSNSAMGNESLKSNTTGLYNSAMGYQSLSLSSTGSYNSATGAFSLNSSTTGSYNSAVGMNSLRLNATGSYNSAMGFESLYSNTTGYQNSAIGHQSLYSNTTGFSNSTVGYQSFLSNTIGSNNTAVGVGSGYTSVLANANTTGSQNTFLGYNSGSGAIASIINGTIKTASVSAGGSGYTVGNTLTLLTGTGTATVQVTSVSSGAVTGFNITNGGGNYTTGVKATIGGSGTGCTINVTALDLYNTTVLGYNATSLRSNSVILGDPTNTLLNVGIGTNNPLYRLDVKGSGTGIIARFNSNNITGCSLATGGTITCTSDQRLKKNIKDIPYGISDIMALRPVSYNWNYENDTDSKSFGFIAQEVESMFPNLVKTDEVTGMKELNTIGLVPILTHSIQQQQQRIVNNEDMFTLFKGETEDKFQILLSSSSETLEENLENQKNTLTLLASQTKQTEKSIETLKETFQTHETQLKALMDFYTTLKLDKYLALNEENNLILPGNLTATSVTTKAITIKNDKDSETIGTATIEKGKTKVEVKTKAITEGSRVFVTIVNADKALPILVSQKVSGEGFTVKINEERDEDISFDWWIVEGDQTQQVNPTSSVGASVEPVIKDAMDGSAQNETILGASDESVAL